jgi:DNA polymerase-3 subunit gamma/tau
LIHRVLSLKYRPQNFDELTGQKHIALSLKGAIKSGRIGHAFLFAGPRGVGKTTTARIFAKNLNCIEGPTIHPCQECQSCKEITLSRSIDVIEIDGASNRGIEEIRNLREGVKYSPLHGRYKVYIIDEVHMLTQEAFNALLKTLEEPPPKVVFIFATTNPLKVPATILSRCQRFVFKRLSVKEIITRLKLIADKEDIKITEKALHYMAVRADGSIRDGESILEQLTSFVEGQITEDDVFKLIGFLGSSFYFELLNTVLKKDLRQVILLLNKGIEDGADPLEIYRGYTNYLRAAFLLKTDVPQEFVDLNDDEINQLQAVDFNRDEIIHMIDICLNFEETIKRSVNVRIALELLFSQLVLYLRKPGEQHSDSRTVNRPRSDREIDLKHAISNELEKNSPKLAAIVHKSRIERSGKNVNIVAENEFVKKQLIDNQEKILSVLNNLLDNDVTLNVDITHQKQEDNNLIKSIKAMFDGEEVR